MLIIGIMAVMLMLGLGGSCVAQYLLAVHQARVAADLAALSGAGEDGCSTATDTARFNRAKVVFCNRVGDQIDFVITIRAEVAVAALLPGLPPGVGAVAYAGPVSG
jgi:hypothetical protein